MPANLPYMELEEIVALLGYTNIRAAKRALKLGTFEIPIFTLAGRPVISIAVAKKYFAEKTEEGELAIELGKAS